GSNPVIPLNTWLHLVATWDGLKIYYYYNGVQKASYNAQLNRATISTSLNYIGRSNWRANGDVDFAGRFDDIRIFNRALSSNEVSQLYALESQTTLTPPQHLSASLSGGTNVSLRLSGQPGSYYVLHNNADLTL